jgi:hypothetical protein
MIYQAYGGTLSGTGGMDGPVVISYLPVPGAKTYNFYAASYAAGTVCPTAGPVTGTVYYPSTEIGGGVVTSWSWAQPTLFPGFISMAAAEGGTGQVIDIHVEAIDATYATIATGDVAIQFEWLGGG